MTDAPKPSVQARLLVSYPINTHVLSFPSLSDAKSVFNNLNVARKANAETFEIEIEGITTTTLYATNTITALTLIDCEKENELALSDISYRTCMDNRSNLLEQQAKESLEEASFGIGR